MERKSSSPRFYGSLTRKAVLERQKALDRYAAGASKQPLELDATASLQAVGALYDLTPPAARERPIDPSGIIEMHRRLSAWQSRLE